MTAKEALEEFTKFVVEIYKDPGHDPQKKTERLKRVLYGILERQGIDKDMSLITETNPTPTCRLVIPIMYKNNVGVTCVLRNYVIRQEPPAILTIAEAMLATCSTAPMFTPMSIGKDFAIFEYISGDLGLSNPIREVIANAHRAFGEEATVACLPSIGCGHPGVNSVPSDSSSAAQVDFLKRVAMDSEKVAQDVAVQMSKLALYHRLSVNYGLETFDPRVWREPEITAALTSVYLNDLEVAKVVDRCADAIKTGHGCATLEQLMHSGGANTLPPQLPPLTPNYVERKAPMAFMEEILFDRNGSIKPGSKTIVVTGIGGCGKTQLVRKLIENHRNTFVSTFIVDGSSRDTLRRDFVRHVRSLGPAHSQASFDDSMACLSQPVPGGQRLLIIDNVDDPSLVLAPFLPRWPAGAVIVTSRNVSRGQMSPAAHLELDVMSLEESVELLVRGSGREMPPSEADKEAAIAVAKELGCHPIALVQAINYMANTGYTAKTYISRLRGYRQQLLNDPATNQLEMRYLTAFAAFDASYDILSSKAQKTLHLLSFFHRQNFPLELIILAAENDFSTEHCYYIPHGEEFERGKEYLKETFSSSGQWNLRELDSIVMSLRNQSLLTVEATQDITLLGMHSLVHEWSRLRVPGEILARVRAAAIRLLCCGAGEDNYRMMQYLFNHVQMLCHQREYLHANDAASFGSILREAGMYHDSAKLWEYVHEAVKNQLGVDHLNAMAATSNLANAYGHLERYSEAEVLMAQVLEQKKRLLGTDHPETIMASFNLAVIYDRLGRFAESELLKMEVLRQQKELFGTEHPNTILTNASLAVTYGELGRDADAEVLKVEVLTQRKRLFGTDHPDTIHAYENLAVTYARLGRYTDAELLQAEALRQRKRLLGAGHPDTIVASNNLAVTYALLGHYAASKELQMEVVRSCKEILGLQHPRTLIAIRHLEMVEKQLSKGTSN